MATTKPTVLFVRGSWHCPQHFDRVRSVFEAADYPTEYPTQVSTGVKTSDNDAWLSSDAKVVKETASKLVVMHSYGGVIGSEAIHEGLGKKAREAKGEKSGVTDLVYLSAFVLPEDQSLASTLGPQLPPHITLKVKFSIQHKTNGS